MKHLFGVRNAETIWGLCAPWGKKSPVISAAAPRPGAAASQGCRGHGAGTACPQTTVSNKFHKCLCLAAPAPALAAQQTGEKAICLGVQTREIHFFTSLRTILMPQHGLIRHPPPRLLAQPHAR